VGVFTYSAEEGSPAAGMPDPVPHRVAQARRRELMRRQRLISAERRRAWVGREVDVLVESISSEGRRAVGRTEGQAPEIDGVVRLTSGARQPRMASGQFIRALVRRSSAYDLDASLLDILESAPATSPPLDGPAPGAVRSLIPLSSLIPAASGPLAGTL
jgi:ribosomal protein S12 methylthiotransferase